MASIAPYDEIPHWLHRQRNCYRKAQRHTDPEINSYTASHALQDEYHNSESTAASNPSGTTDAVFTKLPRPLAKDRKNTLANSRPI